MKDAAEKVKISSVFIKNLYLIDSIIIKQDKYTQKIRG